MIYGGTPSEAAVRGLLRAMFAGGDDEADFNFYDLSQVGGRWEECGLKEVTMMSRKRMTGRGGGEDVAKKCFVAYPRRCNEGGKETAEVYPATMRCA